MSDIVVTAAPLRNESIMAVAKQAGLLACGDHAIRPATDEVRKLIRHINESLGLYNAYAIREWRNRRVYGYMWPLLKMTIGDSYGYVHAHAAEWTLLPNVEMGTCCEGISHINVKISGKSIDVYRGSTSGDAQYRPGPWWSDILTRFVALHQEMVNYQAQIQREDKEAAQAAQDAENSLGSMYVAQQLPRR